MKLYSDKIGPVEYVTFIAVLCFFLPYTWGAPRFWAACLGFSIAGFCSVRAYVRKHEKAWRRETGDDPFVQKGCVLFGTLMMANALLVKWLQK